MFYKTQFQSLLPVEVQQFLPFQLKLLQIFRLYHPHYTLHGIMG